jgi:hypothetical protein
MQKMRDKQSSPRSESSALMWKIGSPDHLIAAKTSPNGGTLMPATKVICKRERKWC